MTPEEREEVIRLIREHGGVGDIKDEADLNYWMRNKARIFGASVHQTGEPPEYAAGDDDGGGTGGGDRIYWSGEPGYVHIEGGPWVTVSSLPFSSDRPFRIIGTGTMECRWVNRSESDPDERYVAIWRFGFSEGQLGNYQFMLYDKNTHPQDSPDPEQEFPLPDDDPSHVRDNELDAIRYTAISNLMFGAQDDGFGDTSKHRRTLLFGDPSYGELIWTPTPSTSMRYQDGYALNEDPEMTYAAPGDYEIRLCVQVGADTENPFIRDRVLDDVLVQPYVHVDWFKLHATVEYIDEEE
jgi:uncharacterized protein YodC (DUF2158 family)